MSLVITRRRGSPPKVKGTNRWSDQSSLPPLVRPRTSQDCSRPVARARSAISSRPPVFQDSNCRKFSLLMASRLSPISVAIWALADTVSPVALYVVMPTGDASSRVWV